MQELLEIVDNDIKNAQKLKSNGLNNSNDINTLIAAYTYFRILIKKNMIEKEKYQMLDAFTEAVECACPMHTEMFEKYYNETYNQHN